MVIDGINNDDSRLQGFLEHDNDVLRDKRNVEIRPWEALTKMLETLKPLNKLKIEQLFS